MGALARALKFFAPDLTVQEFPAWDCLPYDRVSPHAALVAQRMTVLSQLVRAQRRGSVLLTTVNAALQRVPPADYVARQSLSLAPGQVLAMDDITGWLEVNGFMRASTVRERLHQIEDYYEARQQALAQRGPGPPYKPLSPQRLYFTEADWRARLDAAALVRLTPFKEPEGHGHLIDVGTKQGRNFAAERAEPGRNVFEAATRHVSTLKADGKRVIVALWSDGALERMCHG